MNYRRIINSTKTKEIYRFCLVGALATGIHYGIYFLLSKLINVNIAFTTGYLISLSLNFYLSNKFTFNSTPNSKKGIGFALCHVVNYLLQIGFLNFFLQLGVSKAFAPLFVFPLVFPINFYLIRTVLKSKRLS